MTPEEAEAVVAELRALEARLGVVLRDPGCSCCNWDGDMVEVRRPRVEGKGVDVVSVNRGPDGVLFVREVSTRGARGGQ